MSSKGEKNSEHDPKNIKGDNDSSSIEKKNLTNEIINLFSDKNIEKTENSHSNHAINLNQKNVPKINNQKEISSSSHYKELRSKSYNKIKEKLEENFTQNNKSGNSIFEKQIKKLIINIIDKNASKKIQCHKYE